MAHMNQLKAISNELFFFRNKATYQVLASVTSRIEHDHLRQLPFPTLPVKNKAERNTRPPKLRIDHWDLLVKMCFPSQEMANFVISEYLRYRRMRGLFPTKEELDMPVAERQVYQKRMHSPLAIADIAQIVDIARQGSSDTTEVDLYWKSLADVHWVSRWPEFVVHHQAPSDILVSN